jgi:glycosyltransferase involved in cell wall biosynthesis
VRILVLTNLYPPESYGGYELCCRDVVERWVADGHDVAVLTSDHRAAAGGMPPGPADPVAVEVSRSLSLSWDRGTAPRWWRRPITEWRARRTVRRRVAADRPEVISLWNAAGLPASALAAAVQADVPVVAVFADNWPGRVAVADPWLAPLSRIGIARRMAALSGLASAPVRFGPSSILCFCSADLRDRVAEATGWPVTDAVITPLGIDPRDFPTEDPSPLDEWSWRLLYVGRLDPGKGIDTLVRSLARLPAASRLRVVGAPEPEHVRRIEALVADLKLAGRVELGPVARSELAKVYRSADVCVFPSEWPEPFGIVPLEAMACGTPVVATGVGGSADFLADGTNCLRYTPGDPQALAAAITRLAGDLTLRASLVQGGRKTAGDLTIDRLAGQLQAVHQRAVRAAASGT